MEVFDIRGRQVSIDQMHYDNVNKVMSFMVNASSGIYIVKMGSTTQKIILQK